MSVQVWFFEIDPASEEVLTQHWAVAVGHCLSLHRQLHLDTGFCFCIEDGHTHALLHACSKHRGCSHQVTPGWRQTEDLSVHTNRPTAIKSTIVFQKSSLKSCSLHFSQSSSSIHFISRLLYDHLLVFSYIHGSSQGSPSIPSITDIILTGLVIIDCSRCFQHLSV